MNITFGEYLTNKRKEKEMSLRMLAKELDISPAYLSDVENNRRNALSYEKLQKVIEILKLDEEEQRELYDLAGKAKDTIPADVEEFVKRVKRTIISGVSDIFLICLLYAYDVLPIKVYVAVGVLCLYVLLYFLCGSYRYVSIMLKLLILKKNEYKTKDFKRKLTDQERECLNKKLNAKS